MIENQACRWGGILCRFLIKIMPSILILLLCFLLSKAPLHLHSSPMDSVHYILTLHERLNFLRKASATTLSVLVSSIPELWTCLPQEYLWELGDSDRTICLRGTLVCWAVPQGRIVPREMLPLTQHVPKIQSLNLELIALSLLGNDTGCRLNGTLDFRS